LNQSVRENELLQKQLEDLGRQVQSLLREIARRDDPTLLATADEQVQHMAADDTDTLITNNLVLFKSISEQDGVRRKEYKYAMERVTLTTAFKCPCVAALSSSPRTWNSSSRVELLHNLVCEKSVGDSLRASRQRERVIVRSIGWQEGRTGLR
jgi:hypothetical protein